MAHNQNKLALVLGGCALLVCALIVLFAQQEKPSRTSPLTTGPARYNCELSGGSFESEKCVCPIEEELGQTQELMYDKSTGYCQTTFGGPGGDAFFSSIGAPYREYSFWRDVIVHYCETTGGTVSGLSCACPSDKNYNKLNGKCE